MGKLVVFGVISGIGRLKARNARSLFPIDRQLAGRF
jgi:hypothetical protein